MLATQVVHTTDSRHALPVAENLLDRQFQPEQPNTAWAGDITYVRTDSGWLYLAVVIELYSRKVIGWACAPHMQSSLVCQALNMAPRASPHRGCSCTPTVAVSTPARRTPLCWPPTSYAPA